MFSELWLRRAGASINRGWVMAGNAVFELPHALAEGPTHFGQSLGAEEKQDDNKQYEKMEWVLKP
jgi:hypothetical protein